MRSRLDPTPSLFPEAELPVANQPHGKRRHAKPARRESLPPPHSRRAAYTDADAIGARSLPARPELESAWQFFERMRRAEDETKKREYRELMVLSLKALDRGKKLQ